MSQPDMSRRPALSLGSKSREGCGCYLLVLACGIAIALMMFAWWWRYPDCNKTCGDNGVKTETVWGCTCQEPKP